MRVCVCFSLPNLFEICNLKIRMFCIFCIVCAISPSDSDNDNDSDNGSGNILVLALPCASSFHHYRLIISCTPRIPMPMFFLSYFPQIGRILNEQEFYSQSNKLQCESIDSDFDSLFEFYLNFSDYSSFTYIVACYRGMKNNITRTWDVEKE